MGVEELNCSGPGKSLVLVWSSMVSKEKVKTCRCGGGGAPRDSAGSGATEEGTFHFHALEKEMATHSSVLAWRIPGTGEPGGLPSMGSHRVGHD